MNSAATYAGIPSLLPNRLTFDGLQSVETLVLLSMCAAWVIWRLLREEPVSIAWPGMFEARLAGGRLREARRWFAIALRAGALLCLALALARPVAIRSLPPAPGLGLDIVVVLDTSASMRALDAEVDSRTRTRLDLAKQVVARFARHRVEAGDRVGLVVFGERAFTQCPLTSDSDLLSSFLERVTVGIAGESTALGDALALAVKRSAPGGMPDSPLQSVVVLLTDGRSNAGAIPVDVAIELARASDVRVHTVGIGTGGAEVPMARVSPASPALRFERHDPDHPTLERIAAQTGGSFFAARRTADLAGVYAKIDALERRERELPARIHERETPEIFLACAGGLVLLELALVRVLRRTIP